MKRYFFFACLLCWNLMIVAQSSDVRIRDCIISTLPDDNYKDFVLQIEPQLNVQEEAKDYRIRAVLEEMDITMEASADQILSFSVVSPEKWTTDNPKLYTLTLNLEDAFGTMIEQVKRRIGFRSVEVRNATLWVNGRPAFLCGVDQYRYYSRRENMKTRRRMVQDMLRMKQLNVNAVRTRDHLKTSDFHELCDSLGLYAFQETNADGTNSYNNLSSRFLFNWSDIVADRSNIKDLEIKKTYAPVEFKLAGRQLQVIARDRTINLHQYRCLYQLTVEGDRMLTGEFTLPNIRPGETGLVSLPLWGGFPSGKDVRLRVSLVLRYGTLWGPKGHEITWDQFCLQQGDLPQERDKYRNPLYTRITDDLFSVTNRRFGVSWNMKEGNLVSLTFDGREILSHPEDLPAQPVTQALTIPVDNEYMPQTPDIETRSFNHRLLQDGSVLVEVTKTNKYEKGSIDTHYQYTVLEEGEIDLQVTFIPMGEVPDISRLGITFYVDSILDTYTWYGRGPQDSSSESKAFVDMGRWRTKINEQVHSQENGNKEEIHYLMLTNSRNRGLKIDAIKQTFSASALHYTTQDIYMAKQNQELQARKEIILNLDAAFKKSAIEKKPYTLHVRLGRK